jgi:hypothetical protein
MPRGKTTVSGIGQADLTYAVNRLIALGKTNAREITGLAAERPMRIAALEKELSSLRTGASPASSNGAAARTATATRAAPPAPTKKKRRFTMTPKALKARKLQGRYLGLLRKRSSARNAARRPRRAASWRV